MPRNQPKSAGRRSRRLQIVLSPQELDAIEEFRFSTRQPNRAEAVRALVRSGLDHPDYAGAVGRRRLN